MTTDTLAGTITTKANVYFDGNCVSHTVTMADGTRKSVGVVLAATLTFSTSEPEIMETVAGSCEVKLPDSDKWQKFGPGESFKVAANESFEIRVEKSYHYICHYG